MSPTPSKMRFGVCEVDPASGELRKQGIKIKLHDQPFRVLCLLLERPGEVISREQLCKALWPEGTFVESEVGLNSAVMKLRDALGDSAGNPRFVETLPRKGYRFLAEVHNGIGGNRSGADAVMAQIPAATSPVVPSGAGGRSGLYWVALLAACALVLTVVIARKEFHPQGATGITAKAAITMSRITHAGDVYTATISPSGEFVAYVRDDGGRQSLWLRQMATGHEEPLIRAAERRYWGLTFSNDGAYIYYVSSEKTENGKAEPTAQLYRMALLGGPAVKLKDDLDSAISFSPDGKSYAFIREVTGANESRLITASLESGSEKTIASRTLPDIFDFPTWAPDGKSIAAVAASYSAADRLMIYAADGSGQKQTSLSLRDWGHIYKIEWGNLSSIFVAGKDWNGGDFQLWQVAYPSGEVTRLTNDLNAYFRVSATKDSQKLVTVQESAAQSIWVAVDGDAGKTTELSSLAEHYYGIGWMPDGQIVYDSDASGQSNIWVMDQDGNSRKQITRGENFDRYPVASPDGKYIFYVSCARLDRECDIWKIDRDGTNPRRITEGSRASGLAITPDGQWLVYTAPTLGRYSTIWKIPISGGSAQRVNSNLATLPAVSADGKRIACFYTKGEGDSQVEKPVLAILPIAGGAPEKIFEIPPTVNILAGLQWVDGGTAIAYVDDGPRNSNLWKQPLNGGPAKW